MNLMLTFHTIDFSGPILILKYSETMLKEENEEQRKVWAFSSRKIDQAKFDFYCEGQRGRAY